MITSALTQWSARCFLVLAGSALIASCSTGPNTAEETADTTASAEGETCAPELAELDFGIISTESQDNLKTQWEPFLEAMEAEIGRPINGFYATDYAG
jgi:phosphonate transport system substrate-binding protein